MKEYLRERNRQEKVGTVAGIALTAALHLAAGILVFCCGLTYLDPPPPEDTFLMDFSEQEEVQVQIRQELRGEQPRAVEIDRSRPIELAQKSESPYVATTKRNETPASAPDPVGDVEVSAVEQEAKLDPRAAFPGMGRKDTSLTAPHAADVASDKFKEGQPEGNTLSGRTDGTPNAHLKGRNTVGNLPRPAYNIQSSGVVVVKIWVDNYGNVRRAQPGAQGTTVTDKTLWAAARKAAMESHFNQSGDAPALQEGTITYVFKLK